MGGAGPSWECLTLDLRWGAGGEVTDWTFCWCDWIMGPSEEAMALFFRDEGGGCEGVGVEVGIDGGECWDRRVSWAWRGVNGLPGVN